MELDSRAWTVSIARLDYDALMNSTKDNTGGWVHDEVNHDGVQRRRECVLHNIPW